MLVWFPVTTYRTNNYAAQERKIKYNLSVLLDVEYLLFYSIICFYY